MEISYKHNGSELDWSVLSLYMNDIHFLSCYVLLEGCHQSKSYSTQHFLYSLVLECAIKNLTIINLRSIND